MPLKSVSPPAEALRLISANLKSLLAVQSATSALMRETAGEAGGVMQEIAAPHQVYSVGLDGITETTVASGARPTSLRYIILRGETPEAAAELTLDENGRVSDFSHINRGPFVASTIAGIAVAEELETKLQQEYELRLLSIPSLYLMAVWLVGEEDLFIPLDPVPDALKPLGVYTEKALALALQELVTLRRLSSTNEPF